MVITLVLGGARSGKTRYALKSAEAQAGPLVMIATAEALDEEMAERIARHRVERGPRWRTVEAPLALVDAIEALSPDEISVVDCVTLWLSNVMLAGMAVGKQAERLLAVLDDRNVILVSNEVGGGVVPDNALARRFRDEAGRLNQLLAAHADKVVLVTAGLPLILKP